MTNLLSRAKVAFVFPGQGSQSLKMMKQLRHDFPLIGERFEIASEILEFDLWQLIQEGPLESLNMTQNTQPALLAASLATWDAWISLGGVRPQVLAGHSFGEYTALVCAGSLDYRDAVALVAERGRLMQLAVAEGTGSMAAILGLEEKLLRKAIDNNAQIGSCDCANFNAGGQIVISGEKAAVLAVCDEAKVLGAKRAIVLPVSVPAHSRLMIKAAEQFSETLSKVDIIAPKIPLIHNVDVGFHEKPEDIKTVLKKQLYSPVRWTETGEKLAQLGCELVLECGPGKVLSGLMKKISQNMDIRSLSSREIMETEIYHAERIMK
ncbi:MAG: ACP S-malonyltransferase [Gammaproteobacteria bacterium]|nr:ACP S-malonyltransferase [Gammaproteobacteria bacterium]